MAPPRLPVYLDHQATTPTDPRVVEAMLPLFVEEYGNAASHAHRFGWRAAEALESARETLAGALGAEPREIVFTSGATESNNLAILGAAEAAAAGRDHVVTVATEHAAVLDPCRALAHRGWRVTVLPVGADGLVDPDAVGAALCDRTLLVSVMAANNEIGVLQPLAEIGARCRARGVLFHTDAAQAFGREPLDVAAAAADLVSVSAHKLYGPKGVGALYVRAGRPRVRLVPRVHGGGHERGLRSGTVAVPLAVGFARALEICRDEGEAEARRVGALRDRLLARLAADLDGVRLNGHPTRRLRGNLHVSIAGVDADRLLAALPELALSSRSACAGAASGPSHVLTALGQAPQRAREGLRIGIGRFNTPEEIEFAADRLVEEARRLRGDRPRKAVSAPLSSAGSREGAHEEWET